MSDSSCVPTLAVNPRFVSNLSISLDDFTTSSQVTRPISKSGSAVNDTHPDARLSDSPAINDSDNKEHLILGSSTDEELMEG